MPPTSTSTATVWAQREEAAWTREMTWSGAHLIHLPSYVLPAAARPSRHPSLKDVRHGAPGSSLLTQPGGSSEETGLTPGFGDSGSLDGAFTATWTLPGVCASGLSHSPAPF